MNVESYTLKELEKHIQDGKTYRLFKPFLYNGQILLNVEKIITIKDIYKLENKIFSSIQVIQAVEHNTDDKIRKAIISKSIEILKSSKLFKVSDICHLDFTKRKECEKLISAIINGNPHLAQQLLKIYQYSKKLFIHTINVAIISTVIDLGLQEKEKKHDALQSEELLTAAFLHDVGFLKLPQSMITKKRYDYDIKEKALYKTYPHQGKEIAMSLGDNIRMKPIEIIFQHKEKLDGSGFPESWNGNSIDKLALIVGLADEFDLIMSNETSSSQRSTSEVMSKVSRMGMIFGKNIVDSFYTWFRYLTWFFKIKKGFY